MTAIFDEPERFAASALEGLCDLHSRLVHPVPGGALRVDATKAKVALVIGGGSGNDLGYVGAGRLEDSLAPRRYHSTLHHLGG